MTQATSSANLHAINSNNETNFKYAVNFFENLGRKEDGSPRSCTFPYASTSVEHPNRIAYIGNRKYELDNASYSLKCPVELGSGATHELGNEIQRALSGLSKAHLYHTPSTCSPLSWEDEINFTPPPYSPPTVASGSLALGIRTHPGASRRSLGTHDFGGQALITPVSRTRDSPALYEEGIGELSVDLCPTNVSPNLSTPQNTSHLLDNYPHRIDGKIQSSSDLPPLINEAKEYSSKEEPATTRIYLRDLGNAVRAMSEEWIRRLAPIIDIKPPCPERYAHAVVEIGFRALRNYFRGTIPSSFQDVFALMHVAGASAYIIHKDDQVYSWDAFLADTHRWQNVLSDEIEKATFVKVTSRLSYPQGYKAFSQSPRSLTDDTFLPAEGAVLLDMLSNLPSLTPDAALQEQDHETLDPLAEGYQVNDLCKELQRGAAIQACTNFLDRFEYTVLVEDSANRQAAASWYCMQYVHNISMMGKKQDFITKQLQAYASREGFGGGAVDTKVNVPGGLQRNIRELEVTLMSTARSLPTSSQSLAGYLNVVNSLCDEVMQEMGKFWRNKFYAIALNTVLILSFQFFNCPRQGSSNPQLTPSSRNNGESRIGPPNGVTASHTSAESTTSTSTHTSLTSTPNSSDDTLYCPDPSCHASFTGLWRKANLERHRNTALHHNQKARFKCETCQKRFSRADNVQQHMRHIHKVNPL